MSLGSLFDPIPNYKYGLEIGAVLVAGFTSCSGLEISRDTKEVVEGGINDHVHVLPGPLQHGRVTFKRGITYTSFLWEWIHWGMHDTAVLRLPVVIIRYDVSGLPVRIWPLLGAYPVKWVGEAMDGGSREAAVETLELAFGGRVEGGAGGAEGGGASAGGAKEADKGVEPGSEAHRQLAQKVTKLIVDSMRVERERVGKAGGY